MKTVTLRTPETEELYKKRKEERNSATCPLCEDKETLHAFTHWRIVENSFPYDVFAEVHHMILPLRHITERELTEQECAELLAIKEGYIAEHYNFVMEPTATQKSIPSHFHLHLVVPKTPTV